MKFSVIIPAHNEEASIGTVVRALEEGLKYEHEIVVVDDHSVDKTRVVVEGLCAEFKNVHLAQNPDNPGFANALKTGFACASTDMVVPVMADLCDKPDTINKMYERSLDGFDVVCGSRYMRGGAKIGGPLLKSLFSRFVGVSLHLLVGIPTHDISNSFKLYRKKVLESIDMESSGFEISTEIALKAYFSGYNITEVPTTWTDRKEGESKFGIFKHGWGYIKLYLWVIWKRISKI